VLIRIKITLLIYFCEHIAIIHVKQTRTLINFKVFFFKLTLLLFEKNLLLKYRLIRRAAKCIYNDFFLCCKVCL